jgi:hypothetical protein
MSRKKTGCVIQILSNNGLRLTNSLRRAHLNVHPTYDSPMPVASNVLMSCPHLEIKPIC